MAVNYKSYLTDVFIGNATLWIGTAVPLSSANISGGQPTAGSFAGLTEQGDGVKVRFKIDKEFIRYEGNLSNSAVIVTTEEMTISATSCMIYGANGQTLRNFLFGNRNSGGAFGTTSGGSFATNSFSVVGIDRSAANRLIIASMYNAVNTSDYEIEFIGDKLCKVSFELTGLIHSTATNGVGKIFYI